MSDARAAADETARTSYGRLLAWLSSRTRDVAAAEDALADAFNAALETWPERGIPQSPEAWLLTTARRKLIDNARRQKTRADNIPALTLAAEEAEAAISNNSPFPDERLKLLFICAHPAIDETIRTPLMLQTVLGLDAAKIASAFLVSPNAMSGRLVRAKRKIKSAHIPFETADKEDLAPRLTAVLEAIYASYGAGWNDTSGSESQRSGLAGEAIYLARLLTKLLPDEPEGWGLLALMLLAEARTNARCTDGQYIPLREQDTNLWNLDMIKYGETALATAWRLGEPGPFQIEAAIQSAHVSSMLYKKNVTEDLVLLYERLVELAPTIGACVGYAGALASASKAEDALKCLDGLDARRTEKYQPFWAVRAHILSVLNQTDDAAEAYDRAIGLAQDNAARKFLLEKKSAL